MKLIRKSLILLVVLSVFISTLSPLGSFNSYADEEESSSLDIGNKMSYSEYLEMDTHLYEIEEGRFVYDAIVYEYDEENSRYLMYDSIYSYKNKIGAIPCFVAKRLINKNIPADKGTIYYTYNGSDWIETDLTIHNYDTATEYTNDKGDSYFLELVYSVYDDGERFDDKIHTFIDKDIVEYYAYYEADDDNNMIVEYYYDYDDEDNYILYDWDSTGYITELPFALNEVTYNETEDKYYCNDEELDIRYENGIWFYYYVEDAWYSSVEFKKPILKMTERIDESWSYDEEEETLYIYEDIIAEEDGFGEYVVPYASYGNYFKNVVLGKDVYEIAYAFCGMTIDRLLIKNPYINMETGLAGATVNCIEFTDDISELIRIKWETSSTNVDVSNGQSAHQGLDKFYHQYKGPYPFIITNLSTNSDKINISEFPRVGDSSNWYRWGMDNVLLIPNQTKRSAEALYYSIFMTNDNGWGIDEDGYGEVNEDEQYDMPVVYGLTASLKEKEYPVGTILGEDDFCISVLGIGSRKPVSYKGSYWNYELKDWVWIGNDVIDTNTYNAEEELKRNYGDSIDGKFIEKKEGCYEYIDSYFIEYQNYGNPQKVFLGKLENGTVYYTYNNQDWIETTFTSQYSAKNNNTYANERGEVYPIILLTNSTSCAEYDSMYHIGNFIVPYYFYIKDNNVYKKHYDNGDTRIYIRELVPEHIIGLGYNDLKSGRYYNVDDSIVISGYSNCIKYENNAVYKFNPNTEAWDETSYTSITDYLKVYPYAANVTGGVYKDGLMYSSYHIVEDGIWYNVNMITGQKTALYGEVYTNELYLPLDYNLLTSIQNTSSANSENTRSINSITVVEGENIIDLDYYGLKTSVKVNGVVPAPITHNMKVIDAYYDINGNLENEVVRVNQSMNEGAPYSYDALTSEDYTVYGTTNHSGTVDKDIVITFTYKKNPPTSFTVKVVDEYYNADDSLEKENIRLTELKEKGTYYTYTALSPDGYTVTGIATYSGTVNQDITVTFRYKKNLPPMYSVKVIDEYYDVDGNLEKQEIRLETQKEENSAYSYNSLQPESYTITSESACSGIVTRDTSIVFTYKKNPPVLYNIKVKDIYLTSDGTEEKCDIRVNIDMEKGSAYSYQALSPNNYTLTSNGAIAGILGQDIVIEFIYKKNPPVQYTLTVQDVYYNVDGTEEKADIRETLTVDEGTSYTYNSLNPEGYTIISENTYSGTMTSDTTVKFMYKKNNPAIPPIVNPIPIPVPPEPKPEPIPEPEIKPTVETKTFVVTFMVENSVWRKISVLEGEKVKRPVDPYISGYEFIDWDVDLETIKTDTTTYAIMNKLEPDPEPEPTPKPIPEPEPEPEEIIEEPIADDEITIVQKNPEKRKINIFLYLLIILLFVLLLPLILLLLTRSVIPFTYILDRENKEMIITGYKGSDREVLIKEHYRPFIFKYEVTEIAANAFNGIDNNGNANFNQHIVSVTVPATILKIGSKAFANCIHLEEIRGLNKNCYVAPDAFGITDEIWQ